MLCQIIANDAVEAGAEPRCQMLRGLRQLFRSHVVRGRVDEVAGKRCRLGHSRDGAHVNAVGASQLSAQEIDVATVADATLFCDSRESVRNEAGEYRRAIEEGAIGGENHIRAELGEVLAGLRPGRQAPGELTLFRSLGIGVEDLAAAELAVARARERGLGTEVEL